MVYIHWPNHSAKGFVIEHLWMLVCQEHHSAVLLSNNLISLCSVPPWQRLLWRLVSEQGLAMTALRRQRQEKEKSAPKWMKKRWQKSRWAIKGFTLWITDIKFFIHIIYFPRLHAGAYKAAIQHYSAALQHNPADETVRYHRALAFQCSSYRSSVSR